MLTLRSQNNLKNISISGDKVIEEIWLENIKSNPEKSSFYTELPVKEINVSNCQIYCDVKLDSEILEEIDLSNKSTFKSLTINHKNANIKIDDCQIEEKLTIGSESTEANSSKFEITNNTIGKGIFFGKHHIKDEFKIENNRLQNGKWKFYGFSLGANCKSEITDQSFDDVSFQNCYFSNFDFQNTDIHLAEIIDPIWKEVDIASQKRIEFKAEKEAIEISDLEKRKEYLKQLKKQYSFFRKKFENENNYVDVSKFKISEALTRIKILKAEKSWRGVLLNISKELNLFGESIARPFYLFCYSILLFTLFYLFTGFNVTEIIAGKNVIKPIEYDLQFFDFSRLIDISCSDLVLLPF